MGVHWTGIVFGLGGVIAFGYWTTDFLVVQRAMAAKDLRSAKFAPIIASYFKMMVPLIVILPGLLAIGAYCPSSWCRKAPCTPGCTVITKFFPSCSRAIAAQDFSGLGVTALIAGFMSGMAGNVSAFATVWTYDIYQPYIRKTESDAHYVRVGRWCTILGVILSIGTAYFVTQFKSIMDYMQALVSFFIAPLFGTVILGMLWKRATPEGRLLGTAGRNSLLDRNVCVGKDSPCLSFHHRAFPRCQGHGGKSLSRALVLDHLRSRDRRRQPVHQRPNQLTN